MKLTNDQEQAAESLYNWYKSPVKQPIDLFYLVDGAAGTGKTTVTRMVIDQLGLSKWNLAVTAPTHQAKKVIQNATGFPSHTIQKILGLRPNVNMDNFDIANPQFDPLAEDMLSSFRVIIIDEASMLNSDAFDLILSKAQNHNIRIIFLGDGFQLPPVKEKRSRVFTDVVHRSTLREIIRQGENNPNSDLLLAIRDDIQNEKMNKIYDFTNHSNIIEDKGFKNLNSNDFYKDLIDFFNSTPAEHDINHIRYLTWTNKSVVQWCGGLRKALLGDASVNQLNIGEGLIGYNTIQDYKLEAITLQNSEPYTIVDMKEGVSPENLEGHYVTLRDTDDEEFVHFVVSEGDWNKFLELAYEKWSDARNAHYRERSRKWGIFFGFRNKHLTLKSQYYKGMPMTKDLYYSYGITVHKSQGSTFSNTAVNLKNILGNRDELERLKLAYVALSRCRNTNLILSK